ncbi:hypothetical protein RQN30_03705 [Arcanobacterium hippocoleae]
MNDKNSTNDPFLETMARLRARVAAAQESSQSNINIGAGAKTSARIPQSGRETQPDFSGSPGRIPGSGTSAANSGQLNNLAARLRARSGFDSDSDESTEKLSAVSCNESAVKNLIILRIRERIQIPQLSCLPV